MAGEAFHHDVSIAHGRHLGTLELLGIFDLLDLETQIPFFSDGNEIVLGIRRDQRFRVAELALHKILIELGHARAERLVDFGRGLFHRLDAVLSMQRCREKSKGNDAEHTLNSIVRAPRGAPGLCGRKADPADGLLEQSAHEAWDAAGDEKVWSAQSPAPRHLHGDHHGYRFPQGRRSIQRPVQLVTTVVKSTSLTATGYQAPATSTTFCGQAPPTQLRSALAGRLLFCGDISPIFPLTTDFSA